MQLFNTPMFRAKKILFVATANILGLTTALFGLEFAVRWRSEHGFVAAWRSLSSTTPFSDLGTGDNLISDPDLGYRFNPGQPGVNSLGLRESEIPFSKSPGVPRIVVLGDSVAAAPQGFVKLVREQLQGKAEVFNASVPGYTTYQERKLLERDLMARRPDLVLLVYCVNDNHRFLHRFDAAKRMLFTEEARRALAPPEGGLVSYLTNCSYLALRLRLALLRIRVRGGEYPWEREPDVAAAWRDESWRFEEEQVAAMHSELQQIGCRLDVVMAPYRLQFDPRLLERSTDYVLKPQRRMTEICTQLHLSFLDLYPPLQAQGGAALFADNYHFNRAGHRAVAESLLRFLDQERLTGHR